MVKKKYTDFAGQTVIKFIGETRISQIHVHVKSYRKFWFFMIKSKIAKF